MTTGTLDNARLPGPRRGPEAPWNHGDFAHTTRLANAFSAWRSQPPIFRTRTSRICLATLALKSGEGLWMAPFRGIPETDMRVPLDLIYLDEDCRVIDVVESFPTFRVTPSSPRAASVLALPTHSIYSSQTQAGRSAGAVRGRGDGAPPGAVLLRGRRCRRSAKRRSAAGKAALERRSRRGGVGGSLHGGAPRLPADT